MIDKNPYKICDISNEKFVVPYEMVFLHDGVGIGFVTMNDEMCTETTRSNSVRFTEL